ncbi:hypothetical protein F4804DRAFT_239171 [Jackrogersella minutella]|nr:hypothetical protein F4804DRAFT_239171 [Jackrogersella minutella]
MEFGFRSALWLIKSSFTCFTISHPLSSYCWGFVSSGHRCFAAMLRISRRSAKYFRLRQYLLYDPASRSLYQGRYFSNFDLGNIASRHEVHGSS